MKIFSRLMSNKKWLLGIALAVIIVFSTTTSAQAAFDLKTNLHPCDGNLFDIECALENIVIGVALWPGKLLALLLELVVKGTIFLIDYGTTMASNPAVTEGFRATLGLTNLIFVLSLIIIAFATILRFENYSIKKMLPKLIIAAILVNFSLLIAGLLLDASNVFTYYFLKGGVSADGIASSFNPQKFLVVNPAMNVPLGQGMEEFLKILVGIAIATIMTLIMTFIMGWVMVMVLVRNIWIAFLLILMPLIWGFWVLPTFQEHWSKWWQNFIKWVIYLPSTTFFLWLAVRVAQNPTFNSAFNGTAGDAVNLDFSQVGGALVPTGIFGIIIRMLIVLGLLVGALRVGKAFGIAGSALAMTGAGFLGKKALGLMGKGAGYAATAPLAGAVGLGVKLGGGNGRQWAGKFFGVKNVGQTLARGGAAALNSRGAPTAHEAGEGFLSWAGKSLGNTLKRGAGLIPGSGQLANVLAGAGKQDSQVEAYQKSMYSNLTDKDLERVAGGPLPVSAVAKAALVSEAAKRHKFDALPHDAASQVALMNAVIGLNPGTEAKDIDVVKSFLKHHPSLARQITGQTASEVRAKMNGGEIADMDEAELKASIAEGAFTASQLAGAAQKDGKIENLIRRETAKVIAKAGEPILGKALNDNLTLLDQTFTALEAAKAGLKTNKSAAAYADYEVIAKRQRELSSLVASGIRGLNDGQRKEAEAVDPGIATAIDLSGRLDRAVSSGGGGDKHKADAHHGGGHADGRHTGAHAQATQSEWEARWEAHNDSGGAHSAGHDDHGPAAH